MLTLISGYIVADVLATLIGGAIFIIIMIVLLIRRRKR